MIVALDFETYYDAEYSIRTLGNWAYVHHKDFEPYLLSVAWEDGKMWQGHPHKFDWSTINNCEWVAHNAGFEWAITERLREVHVIPQDVQPSKIHDTADLTAYLGYPRNLEAACEHLLEVKINKGTRNRAKGKHWNDMSKDFQDEMKEYAMKDALVELEIWLEHSHKWPEEEQKLSRLTRIMCAEGVPIDIAAANDAIYNLQKYLQELRSKIPWAKDLEAPALSSLAVAAECVKFGIPKPDSMAKDSEKFDAWLKDYGDRFEWATAIGEYRRTNNLLKKLQTMKRRTRPDGIMPYGLKYGGAHTLRDSGDSGFNVQNLHRDPFVCKFKNGDTYTIDLRGMITAPEGKILGVLDLVAIEPCILAVLAGDKDLLKRLNKGEDVYEAWARLTKNYADPRPLSEVNPKMRRLCKVEQLGLSYGAGAAKCIKIAKMWAGIDLTLGEAKQLVYHFKARPFIPRFWNKVEAQMRMSKGENCDMELPSGRPMAYHNVKTDTGLSAEIPKLGQMLRCSYWGGSITENIVQATARDVLMWHVQRITDAGFKIILRVHDEVVCLLDEATAEADLKAIQAIMSTPPPWMKTLPVRASGHLCKKYEKG